MTTNPSLRENIGRGTEFVLGCVFLTCAVLKTTDINLFTVQILYYRVFEVPDLLAASALGALFIETGLGMALVLGLRCRGLTLVAVAALLTVFTALIIYGWSFHDLEDCGCFGPIEMSPPVSIAKNLVLLGLAAVAGYLLAPLRVERPLNKLATTAKVLMCLLIAGAVTVYACTQLEPVNETEQRGGPFSQFVFEADGRKWDLGDGEYLVVMLSADCEHCMEVIQPLNDWTTVPGFLPIVGLCYEDEPGSLEEFRALTEPEFPLHSVGDRIRTFFSLVGDVPPRFIYVVDGRQVAYWDHDLPPIQEVIDARKRTRRNG